MGCSQSKSTSVVVSNGNNSTKKVEHCGSAKTVTTAATAPTAADVITGSSSRCETLDKTEGESLSGCETANGNGTSSSSLRQHSPPDIKKVVVINDVVETETHDKSSNMLNLSDMVTTRKNDDDFMSKLCSCEIPFDKPIEEVYNGVHDGPVLGSGVSGVVRCITHRETGEKFAVKCLDLDLVESEEGLQQLREEIFIMCQLDHPNIVRLEEVYESDSEIYLVQELCLGGELFDRLDEQPDYHYTEGQCAKLVKQMLCAVRYIHSKGIIHRDLKLENFLFSDTSADAKLKMIDFGLSKHFTFGEVLHEAVGTPYTVAPEVIKSRYDERCDVWGIGVITFLLLSGESPFGGCDGVEPLHVVKDNILRGEVEFFPEDIWCDVSDQAKHFIKTLLVTDPNQRPTARQALTSTWLQEWAHHDLNKEDNKLSPSVVKALVNFKEYGDMRKLLCELLSFTLLPDQIQELRKEFEKMDTDGTGEISLKVLKKVLMGTASSGSLGALTEDEIEDIFNAMRVRKSSTKINWHEFISAGVSQCKVDDRNIRLAFDRLDSDHKGYITFEDFMSIMGNDSKQSEEAMRNMWGDSMKAVNCKNARINYDDFLLLMKGQTTSTTTKADPNDMSNHSLGTVSESDMGERKESSPEFSEQGGASADFSQTEVAANFVPDAGRAMCMPEHTHEENIELIIHDDSKTPLVVNRQLYRAHRQMRIAVLEASKRFEEEKDRRASARRSESQTESIPRTFSAEQLRASLSSSDHGTKEQKDEQSAVAIANKRGGRTRDRKYQRKRTVSDIGGMVSRTQTGEIDASMRSSHCSSRNSSSGEGGYLDSIISVGTPPRNSSGTLFDDNDDAASVPESCKTC